MDFDKILNEEQKKAVNCTEGAVLVLAGAGSGKTRVLTHRIAHLVFDLNIPARNILAITFTNKAANEMKERLQNFSISSNEMWICTIHSMCNRILRSFGDRIGFTKNFTIYTEQEKDKVVKKVCENLELTEEKLAKKIKWHISNAKNNYLSPQKYRLELAENNADAICEAYEEYQKILQRNNAMDFDDLICKTYQLLTTCEEAKDYFSQKFRYIHVDEFQDTNTIQYKLVVLLSSYHKNVFVVGDDDQSIYSFRGAEVENIFHFQRDFPNCKIFKLERNYRSTKKILQAANLVIKNNNKRMEKTLYTENEEGSELKFYVANDESDEARYVVSQINILRQNGYKLSEMAVLMRINALSRAVEQECLKYGISTKVYGGFKFYERKEIKDITSYLSVIVNPNDEESLLRIINTPKRSIGEGAIASLYATKEKDQTLFEAIMAIDRNPKAPASLVKKILPLKTLLYDLLVSSQTMPLSQFIKYLVDSTKIKDMYDAHNEENYTKLLNIDEYINSVIEFEKINAGATLVEYLANVSLSSDLDENMDNDYLSIATVHSCKGLEFSVVFVIGLDESIFPVSRMDDVNIAEERRLLYVAITRAKKLLHLVRSNSRYLYGARQFMLPSQFLKELQPVIKQDVSQSFVAVDEFDGRRNNSFGYGSKNYYGSNSGYGSNNNYGGGYKQNSNYAKNSGDVFANKTTSSNSFTPKFQRNTTTSLNENKKDLSKFVVGSKVMHKTFGEGKIIAIKKDNYNTYCDVAFVGVGIKTLALQFAPIELID